MCIRDSLCRACGAHPPILRSPPGKPPLPSRQRPHLLSPVPVSVPQRLRHTQEELAAAAQRGARLQNGGQELLAHGERLLRTQEAAEARAVKAKAMLVAKAGEMAQLEAALHVVSSDGFAMHAELVALRQLCVRLGAHPDRVRRTRRQQLSTSIASSRGRALYTGSNNDGIDGASFVGCRGAERRVRAARSLLRRYRGGVRRAERVVVDPFSRIVRTHQPCKHAASDPTLHESRSVEILDERAARWAHLTRARWSNGRDEGGNVTYGEAVQFTRWR